jgi:hypothetical protein
MNVNKVLKKNLIFWLEKMTFAKSYVTVSRGNI